MPFRFANVAGRTALVDAAGQWYDLERLTAGSLGPGPMGVLASGAALHEASESLDAATPDGNLADAEVGAPIPAPRNVFAVGLNYHAHASEADMELPKRPLVFTKFPSCIVGPTADIELRSKSADWEVELVVVIGAGGRDIPADKAWDHVLGLTVGQDISDRRLRFAAKPPHFDLGKSRDTYGPLGPVIVSPGLIPDPDDIALTCNLNGERKQDDRTSKLIFSVSDLIAYISGVMTLAPGDLIFTGTPEGVGVTTQTFLQPGDKLVSCIEGIGCLENTCVQ